MHFKEEQMTRKKMTKKKLILGPNLACLAQISTPKVYFVSYTSTGC